MTRLILLASVSLLAACASTADRPASPVAAAEDQLSYDIFVNRGERGESIYPYRKQAYVFDQMNGAQSEGPAFLINIHKVDSVSDAEAYVSRISAIARYLDEAIAQS